MASLLRRVLVWNIVALSALSQAMAAVPPPVITPQGGYYKGTAQYSVGTSVAGGTIHYTTNGTTPTSSSPVFTPGSVATMSGTGAHGVRAIVVDSLGNSSPVTLVIFTISGPASAALPTISPNGGSGGTSLIVTLASAAAGAQIRYTTDGTVPTTSSSLYTGPITLTSATVQTMKVRAISVASGLVQSGVTTATFTVGYPAAATAPTLTPGASFAGWIWVTAAGTDPNAVIRYTVDGSVPDAQSTQYVGPIYLSGTTTLQARSFVEGKADSPVAAATYAATDAGVVASYSLASYGVLPGNDAATNTSKLQQAINFNGNVANSAAARRIRLYFPAGTYRFSGTISLAGVNNLVIDGQGSTLVFDFSRPFTPFYLAANGSTPGPNNATLENMAIQSTVPLMASGYVSATGSGTFDVLLDAGQSAAALPATPNMAFLQCDPADGVWGVARAGQDIYTAWTSTNLGPHKLRVSSPHAVAVGDYLVLRGAVGQSDIYCQGVQQVTLQNLQLNDSPAMGISGVGVTDMMISHCSVMRADGRTEPMTLAADGIHLSSCRGTVSIQDTTMLNQGDDGINVCGTYFTVQSASGTSVSLAKTTGPLQFAVGEVIEFRDKTTMLPKGQAVVASVTSSSPTAETLVLSHAVTLAAGDLAASRTWIPRVSIVRGTFGGNRGRGILLQTPNSTVQNCRFVDIESSAVNVCATFAANYEALAPDNVAILNNSIEDCNRGASGIGSGAISTFMYYQSGGSTVYGSAGAYANLVVADNTLVDIDNGGIAVKSAGEADISNNTLQNCAVAPITSVVGTGDAIAVLDSANVRVAANAQVLTDYVRLAYDQQMLAAPAGGYAVQPFLIGFSSPAAGQIQYRYSWNVQDALPLGLTSFAGIFNASGALVATLPADGLGDPETWANGDRAVSAPIAETLPALSDGAYTVRMGLALGASWIPLAGADDGAHLILVGTLTLSGGGTAASFKPQQYDVRPVLAGFSPSGPRTFFLAQSWQVNDAVPAGTTVFMHLCNAGGTNIAGLVPGAVPDTGTWTLGSAVLSGSQSITLPSAATAPDGTYTLRLMLFNSAVSPYNLPLSGDVDSSHRVIAGTLTIAAGVTRPIWADPATTSGVTLNGNTGF